MTSPQRSADFRPDPERGVYLTGDIDQSTLDRLTPIILRLQNQNRFPITLYIDSGGGIVAYAQLLHRMLDSKDQDGGDSCRLITVATGTAASAASDLLMAGDYALAYPHALIMCHGVSQRSRAETLTHEKAIDIAKDLANSNERYAIQLANNCISRFIFRIAFLASEFPDIRQQKQNSLLPHTACFIEALRSKSRISDEYIEVLEDALKRSTDNDALDVFASQKMAGLDLPQMPRVQFESVLIKAILDYEAGQHTGDVDWSFRTHGFERIQDKLDLLLNKYNEHHTRMITLLCNRWGNSFLSPEQRAEIEQLPEGERPARVQETVEEILRTLWFFFVSICRSLQKDDYWMTAEEAYWLGLIDEVIGRIDLPCPRIFIEYPPTENGDTPDENVDEPS